ncbi:hypothetical protein GCM10009654_35770 [Streptomyces hebeiensis]|uniref:Uncharacterized protein n=1 Tax=Streptomyces hebeiensis TaxID=229486 RepID=A0ABN1UW99_9ACTN
MQNPSVRPGLPPRARPTGAPQSDREQYRLRSGTSGLSITADRGSRRGTSGTETSPAPSRPGPEEDEEPELRTETERPDSRPERVRDSRPETERRDVEEREDAQDVDLSVLWDEPSAKERADPAEDRDEERPEPPSAPDPSPSPPAWAGIGDRAPRDATTGASPHVSQ